MVRAALYARVSTDDKEQNPLNQLAPLRDYCAQNGFTITGEYIDKASGTGKEERPRFADLMSDAAKRSFDVVLVWKIDRFSREGSTPTAIYIKRLAESSVKFKSLTEPQFDTTGSFGDVLISLFSWMAQEESKRIGQRVKAGIARRKAEGKKFGRANLMTAPERERVESEIRRLRSEGLSIAAIAKRVCYTTKRRKERRVSAGFVHKILTKTIEGKAPTETPVL